MTDTLRDRIAKAVSPHLVDMDAKAVADAVIAELGLRRETESYGVPDSTRHRYVTEWISDE